MGGGVPTPDKIQQIKKKADLLFLGSFCFQRLGPWVSRSVVLVGKCLAQRRGRYFVETRLCVYPSLSTQPSQASSGQASEANAAHRQRPTAEQRSTDSIVPMRAAQNSTSHPEPPRC